MLCDHCATLLIMCKSALFQSFTLFVKTVWCYNPEQGRVAEPASSLVLIVKGFALSTIKSTLTLGTSDPGPLAAAIAMVAAWEAVSVSRC